jgi:hypothetical protein
MLYIVILEVLFVAGMAVAVILDEKKLAAEFDRWLSKKPAQFVYRVPLRLIVREEVREQTKRIARHRYVH